MKNSKDYLSEANALVERVSVEEGIDLHKNKGAVFVDVRDSAAIAESGTINGALRIPRGFIEFAADPDSPFHNAELNRDATIILVCGAGGQAALAGKTLKEMGYESVRNIGGFADWRDAGGETEAA
ncbi:MAG: rhodanese-like domain-containing protein [Betaproteobacteria bacterium]|jgi:rhodanese-related sulfurtransferase|nr:rhodanese-like domain-containing protein [Burkholderiales bacterium]MBT6411060.1 rhodanese-like domain-containing protein [Betaproteobacteria bacterium]MCH1423516.1 rhodanese-like domain-containing protein [Burkholderiales bacterium]MDC0501201.1 rhodanese-like domain-containing protein [Burkholderiales bacterium]